MKVQLHLKDQCIESKAEERYEELVKELLKEEDERKAEKLEFLKSFLENADFSRLRGSGFDGSEEMTVEVSKGKSGFSVSRVE